MNATVPQLTEEYAAALQEYLAEPHEAGLLHAYDLGRRTLTLGAGVAELGRNILTYAGSGEIVLRPAHAGSRRGISVVARDRGPGIPDVPLALQDGYSTSNSLGLGLPGTRRLMDEFAIDSAVGRGTTVTAKKWV